MDYAFGMSWPEARAKAVAGSMIRRANWTDRWLFRTACLWWIWPNEGTPRVVEAADFTATEFLAADWTTIWPDQHSCGNVPLPEPDPQPEPGGPIVQHHESFTRITRFYVPGRGTVGTYGGNFRGELEPENYEISGNGRADFGVRVIENPFAAPCLVTIAGLVDERLHVALNNGYFWFQGWFVRGDDTPYAGGDLSDPPANRGYSISTTFTLRPGNKMRISAERATYYNKVNGRSASYFLTITFTP